MNELNERQQKLDLIRIEKVQPGLKVRYTGEEEITERIWYIALDDIEKNYCMDLEEGRVFSAGGYDAHKDWDGLTFNRDTCYSGLLALNLLYPKEMLQSMKIIRKYRERLKFACTPDMELEGIEGVEVFDLTFREFKVRFHKGAAINKTDDVVWIWCMYDLIKKNHFDEWEWMYHTAKRHFEQFYDPFYDPEDGLYFGQPTFIDVGSNGYPESFGMKTKEAYNYGVWVKASSTNSLYYKALTVMSEAAKRLGLEEEAEEWDERAAHLKAAILDKLRFEDGTFAYFMHKDGHLENRREVLGTAFPVLLDVVTKEEAQKALKGFPVTAFGAPLLVPFYDHESTLHNNSSWPFADTFLLLAFEKAYEVNLVKLNLQIMVNATENGHLREYRNMIKNQMCGATAQLWSCAGFVNACIRGGLTEIDPEKILMR